MAISAKAVPSVTRTRQGWLGLVAGSCPATSTTQVTICPGNVSFRVARLRRSMKLSGRWNNRSRIRPPPVSLANFSAVAGPTPRRSETGANKGASGSVTVPVA